ncbi:MAG TPA: ankyrin repeat domain-containing protein, partial [Candidatus Babeliaceae bacterium]|nr:ankyrin repeat domain-containing protein [Candidatus Babeliaceae bacterium]
MEYAKLYVLSVILIKSGLILAMTGNPPQDTTSPTKELTYQEQQKLQCLLTTSAANGSLEDVKDALDEGAKLGEICNEFRGQDKAFALNAAIANHHIDIAKFLLEQGANPNGYHKDNGDTPLYWAVVTSSPELIDLLMQAGASPLNDRGKDYIFGTSDKPTIPDPSIFKKLFLYGRSAKSIKKHLVTPQPSVEQPVSKPTWIQSIKSYFKTTEPKTEDKPVDKRTEKIIKLFKEVFPHPLIQAIVLDDPTMVQQILSSHPALQSKDIVTDDDNISALAYAAGQANENILSLLLAQPAYKYDTKGLEQAIEIVATILNKRLDFTYAAYQRIFKRLKKQLGTTWNVLINQLSGYTS